jgi:hypothetical protein
MQELGPYAYRLRQVIHDNLLCKSTMPRDSQKCAGRKRWGLSRPFGSIYYNKSVVTACLVTSPITTTRTISPDQIIIPVLNLMGCAFPLCRKSLGRTQHFKLARFILPQRVRRRLSPLCPPMIAMRTNYEFSVVAPRAVFLVVQIYAWVKLCKTSTHKKQPLISLFNQPVQFNRQRPHK